MIGKNLPPETDIEHWQFVQLDQDQGSVMAILKLTTSMYESKGVQVYVYDGDNGSKDVTTDVPPKDIGTIIGETMATLLKAGTWSVRSSDSPDGGQELPF